MIEENLYQQATDITTLLRMVWRKISTLDLNDPATQLPIAQLRVCNMLLDGPLAISELTKELRVSFSAMTQIADRLVRAGMAERVSAGCDKRVKHLQLTTHGLEILLTRRQTRVKRAVMVLEKISPDEREALLSSLNSLLDACEVLVANESDVVPLAE